MTNFQIIAVGVFVLLLLAAYGRELLAVLSRGASAVRGVFSVTGKKPSPLGPKERVRDLVTIAELRDRLAEVNCQTGVEACTLLLRAMVDHPSCDKN